MWDFPFPADFICMEFIRARFWVPIYFYLHAPFLVKSTFTDGDFYFAMINNYMHNFNEGTFYSVPSCLVDIILKLHLTKGRWCLFRFIFEGRVQRLIKSCSLAFIDLENVIYAFILFIYGQSILFLCIHYKAHTEAAPLSRTKNIDHISPFGRLFYRLPFRIDFKISPIT